MHTPRLLMALLGCLYAGTSAAPAHVAATAGAPEPEPIALAEGLAISDVVEGGRVPFPRDAVAQRIVDGTLGAPKAGDTITGLDQEAHAWASVTADGQGQFAPEVGRRGYLYVNVPSDRDHAMILRTVGNAMTYVNGEPRAGDPYAYGFVRLPVMLKKGDNGFLFAMAGRGPMRATLSEPPADVALNLEDTTLPDLVRGSSAQTVLAGIVVMNTTSRTVRVGIGVQVRPDGPRWKQGLAGIDAIPPLSVRKVAFELPVPADLSADEVKYRVLCAPIDERGEPVSRPDEGEITLRVRDAHQTHKRTFMSGIDNSVQYYAVVPPVEGTLKRGGVRPSMVLSLHGAGVQALGQAEAYSAKPNQYIVCPTNRRPFGFDWEDWGATDALEVLDRAADAFDIDRTRVYLTGHSMGGHGSWNVGSNFARRFAAIAPSAGWLSFATYAATNTPSSSGDRMAEIFKRSAACSDTIPLLVNLRGKSVYILHGDADDNVPVTEARRAREELSKLGITPTGYHEQPGAGHWWDDDQPGAACVDWPPIFASFDASAPLPEFVLPSGEHLCVAAGMPGEFAGGEVRAQEHIGLPSRVTVAFDQSALSADITTDNVAGLVLGRSFTEKPWLNALRIDGQAIDPGKPRIPIILRRTGGTWAMPGDERVNGVTPDRRDANLARRTLFKGALDRRFVLVFGTGGSDEERAAVYAKARYDAEQWWYRGNGGSRLTADTDYIAMATSDEWQQCVLYGAPAMNSAWTRVWPTGALVQIKAGSVVLGEDEVKGSLAVLHAQVARSDGDQLISGAVAGTDARAMRATFRLPYFASGVGYPDLTIMTADAPSAGMKAVQAAGFFGLDWSVAQGEWVMREAAK